MDESTELGEIDEFVVFELGKEDGIPEDDFREIDEAESSSRPYSVITDCQLVENDVVYELSEEVPLPKEELIIEEVYEPLEAKDVLPYESDEVEQMFPQVKEKHPQLKLPKKEGQPDGIQFKSNVDSLVVGKRYLLFDDLVANVVDYDEEGTPIVEFCIQDSEEKLAVECGICPDIMHKSQLARHLKTHLVSGTNRYKCIYCDETYKDYKYLAGHARRHMGIRPYACQVCTLYFSTKQDLRVHNQRRHHEKNLICEICGKAFSQNTRLKRHRESTHEKKRRFRCPHCPKEYYKNFSLQEHIRSVHEGNRRMLVCPFCGMECRDAHKMARHRKELHLNQTYFQCHICQETFTDINYFDAHKRSIQCRNNTRKRMEEEEQIKMEEENLIQLEDRAEDDEQITGDLLYEEFKIDNTENEDIVAI